MEKVGDDLFFQNGWPDFVEENFLQLGDILVFKYQGNSQFDVKMFDKTGCEKEEASVEKNDECGSYTEVKEEQSKEIVLVKSTNTCQCSLSQIKRKMQSSGTFGKINVSSYSCFLFLIVYQVSASFIRFGYNPTSFR